MNYVKAARHNLRHMWEFIERFNSYTLGGKLILAGVAISMYQNMLFGLYPAYYSLGHRKILVSKILAAYSLVFVTLYSAFYVSSIWKDYVDETIDQRNVIQFYCYMSLCVCLLNYIEQWLTFTGIIEFQNSVKLIETIDRYYVSMWSGKEIIILLFFKVVACPCLMYTTLVVYFKHREPISGWLSTGTTMLPIFIANMVNNCFFGSLVIAKAVLLRINLDVRDILKETNRLQTLEEMKLQKPYYRMQRFCELSERLDELVYNYNRTTRSSMGYVKFASFSLVISLTTNLVTTTMGCYSQYQAITDYIMLEEPFDLFRAVAYFVFILVQYLEILFAAQVSQQVVDEGKETGNLLQRMDLQHADVRFKQSVDAFWLDVCTIKYKLMPLGLFELNESIVNKIFSTVAGFLLFLIQNDLTLRFTLK